MKAGFARLDITPSLGTALWGYTGVRIAESVLDPLYATTVVFDDGYCRAAVLSIDIGGITQWLMDSFRKQIAEAINTKPEAVFIACTHTHTGPKTYSVEFVTPENEHQKYAEPEYVAFLTKKLVDTAVLALQDTAPAKMFYTQGRAEKVAFVRRYHMKDGSVRTNPGGYQNPNVIGPVSEPDECVSTLILKREGKPEIGIVNFQVHPDVIGECKISADYPKFIRDTYEKLIDNSLCMYINGTQGDTNHIDCMYIAPGQCRGGYDRARYMGRKIAMAAVENYELAVELSGDRISFAQKNIFIKVNKGTKEEIEEAYRIVEQHMNGGDEAIILPERYAKQKPSSVWRGALRILANKDRADKEEIPLTAIAVGDMVFIGIPGEPFTDVGRTIKRNTKYTLVMPACCANGYAGYFPMSNAFDDGGYEALSARFACGTAEQIIDASVKLINSL